MAFSIEDSDLVDNPTARVPVCLCLDTSGSMAGDSISELNEGVQLFFRSLREDEVAKYSAEVAIVTFGSEPSLLVDFSSIEHQCVPELTATGLTAMGAAVEKALDLLEKRKKAYSEAGIDYYQPWLVLMTDGQPTDNVERAVARTSQLVRTRKLTIFPIGVGPQADLGVLAKFSPNRSPLRLRDLAFSTFFEWLSKSVSRVSQSMPGEDVPLDQEGVKGWATI